MKAAILDHGEFRSYEARVAAVLDEWCKAHETVLKGLETGANPREIIRTLAEDLLARFAGLPLLDPYDVYQRLMDYWDETMQDDVYLITADGWNETIRPRSIIEDKGRKIRETPDLTIKRVKYKMDLLPPGLIVSRYFASEQTAIEALQAKQETAHRELEEFIEEHTGEEGLLADVVNDKGKVTKSGVTQRLTAIRFEPESAEEQEALKQCRTLIEAETEVTRAVKVVQDLLDEKVLARYTSLTENEIRTLVVEDKWFASILAAIEDEVQGLTRQLAGRVTELEERYARPLPELEREVEAFGAKIEEHLRRMGISL